MTHGTRPLRSVRRLANLTSGLPKWYSITNSAAGGPALVSIYDEIGFYGVPAAAFLDDLHQVPGDIELHLNSPGGDIYEGLAIYNGLLQARKRGDVRVIVDGLAASAASFIAMAASPGRLEIGQRARMMIHDGFCMAIGNAADMRELADQLDAESDNIAAIYADRKGRRSTLIGVTIAIMAFGFVLAPLMNAGTTGVVLTLVIGLSLMGLTYGPLGTALSELFPPAVRYTGSSLTFNLAGIFGASLAPYIATWLATNHGLQYVGYYLSFAALLTLGALLMSRETKDDDLLAAEA